LTRLAWPIALSTVSYSMMTLVDTLLIGKLGAAQLAGVGLAGTVAFALLCFPFGLLRGVKTLVAQAIGAGKREEAGAYLGAALGVGLGLGLVCVGAGQLVGLLLAKASATPEAGRAAGTYFRLRILGAPMTLAYVALREVRYAQSDARSPMRATVAANLVNIGLAWTFVFRLRWGVAGAATATIIAQSVELGVLWWSTEDRVERPTRRHVRELWKIGLPTGLQFTLEVGAFTMLAILIAKLSEVQMAAHQIALQVIHFSFLPAYAVSEAASVMAGQAVGAARDDLVSRVARQSMTLAGAYTGFCTLVLAGFAPLIVSAFTSKVELQTTAVHLLWVAAVFQVFDGANIIARGVLRGAGDVDYAAVVGVVTSWVMTPPLTYVLGYGLKLGALGGWIGLCAEIILGATLLWWRLARNAWAPAAAKSRERIALAAA
jgi:MATE family multidrug resistance protein